MNERIKQLAEQAWVYQRRVYQENGVRTYGEQEQVFSREKFAELIVRECIEVLIENGDKQFTIRTVEPESHNKTSDWMEGYEEAVKHYGSFLLKKNAKLIQKHFGVKE